MKRSYKLKNLGCSNCAAKMERQIGALPHVNACTIAFMTSKMVLDADDAHIDAIAAQAQSIVKSIEPTVELVRA
jgi:Cation transport ATPase